MSHIADESSPNGAIFKRMLDSIEAGNQAMALEIAEELVNENKEAFFPYLMRAVAYCYMKEDGKALKDWMTSISLMEKNEKMDAYVCIISKSVSDLIIADEREFVDFDYLSHIDRVCEALDEHLECNCKGFVYLTVFTCFMSSYLGMEEDEKEQCGEIIPNLVQRTVAYSRDVSVIKDVVNECLGINDYDESTYEEDDNYDLYALSRIVEKIEKNLPNADRSEFPDMWTDAEMKTVLEGYLAAILACEGDTKPLEKYAKKSGTMTELDLAIEDYSRKYLRIR
ncbi:MAG: hypothetical protein IKM91_08080 [Candidatus Methanomethylophilaceae archaeon]|nr:hypothetical protein [Candidatus Methanomethylophilaceae archaeon]MBR6871555.1 hypothetical protein [Candidatus Methanomethylophilaceae archaeon]